MSRTLRAASRGHSYRVSVKGYPASGKPWKQSHTVVHQKKKKEGKQR